MDRTVERYYFGDLGMENFFDVNDQVRVFIPGQASGFVNRDDVTALYEHLGQLLKTAAVVPDETPKHRADDRTRIFTRILRE